GYIKDDDSKSIDADAILKSIKEGTAQDNEQRRQQGIPELEIVDWIEKPNYETGTHHLIWSLEAKEPNAPADADNTVNYNTYALGRGGYISLNLVTAMSTVEKDKAVVRELLSNLTFNDGKRYEDFNASTDKVAEYGLLALIGGLAVKKLGLFALAAAFL